MIPDGGPQPLSHPLSDTAKSALALTRTLFRAFLLTVLGSFFVYSLNVSYLWLSAILTVASAVLGVVVLVRTLKYKQPRLVLFGTISGLIVTGIMCLLLLFSALFFNQLRTFQDCARPALTEQARTLCQLELEKSLPTGMR
jgi:uncharacterized membrane protein YedE/YeeE